MTYWQTGSAFFTDLFMIRGFQQITVLLFSQYKKTETERGKAFTCMLLNQCGLVITTLNYGVTLFRFFGLLVAFLQAFMLFSFYTFLITSSSFSAPCLFCCYTFASRVECSLCRHFVFMCVLPVHSCDNLVNGVSLDQGVTQLGIDAMFSCAALFVVARLSKL